MLKKLKQSNAKGFTIIEVMIVLAIAGLILLIVLLAIPALQRNSRNTQIKNDASALVGAISTFASDNDGAIPDDISAADGTVTLKKGTTITGTAKIQAGTDISSATAEPTTAPDSGNLVYVLGVTCEGNTSTRSISIYYSTESSGSDPTMKCINS